MRILVLSNIFPPGFIGGYELGALDMARGLAAHGHKVEILTSDYFPDDTGVITDLPVRRILQCAGLFNRNPSDNVGLAPVAAFIVPRNVRLLAAEIICFRPDRVLCFNLCELGALGLLQYLVAMGYRPVLFLMDNVFWGIEAHPERRIDYERAFGIGHWLDEVQCVFISRNLQHVVETALGRPVVAASLIPGWFDSALTFGKGPIALPGALVEEDESRKRFIFASRIAAHKGIEIILAAARSLLDHGHDKFRIDVVGAGDVAQMLQKVVALQLQDHVYYEGCLPREALLRRYCTYDALLFPTWPRESFGFVVCEAAAAGCIPVMTSGIGAAEWFVDGQDALMVRNDTDGVITAMLKLMMMPSAERKAMRLRAHRTAHRFFGFAGALDKLEAVVAASESRSSDASSMMPRQARAVEAALRVLTEVWRTPPGRAVFPAHAPLPHAQRGLGDTAAVERTGPL